MTVTYVKLELRVTLLSNMHVGTGFGKGKLVDDLMVQSAHPRLGVVMPSIPGSTLKGRIKERFGELAGTLRVDDDTTTRIFGTSSHASKLVFDHAHIETGMARGLFHTKAGHAGRQHVRTSVSIDSHRRVARPGQLLTIDVADADLVFVATISGHLPSISASDDLTCLAAAASLVTHVGAHKARGLGNCWIRPLSSTPELVDWDAWSRLKGN